MPDKSPPPQEKLQDFYQELEALLKKQLEHNPGLDDVRLKLLDLYYEQHRRDDFLKVARDYQRHLKKPAESREWQRIASMGRMLLPGEGLFSGHESDRVEFVGLPVEKAPEPAKVRRFGDEEKHRAQFDDLARRYEPLRSDPKFLAELEMLLIGLPTRRPTPLVHAKKLSEHVAGAQIHLKREDVAGDHAHLTVAVTGQALLARRLGCKVLVTGTTDGHGGVATAQVAARLGLRALVYMDEAQAQRATANTLFMKLLGAELQLVKTIHYRNRDVREAALDYWSKNPGDAFLMMGLDAAPPPYPVMTQDFVAAIGRECRRQMSGPGKALPDLIVTRGSHTADALGLFPAFFADAKIRLVCVEPEPEAEKDRTEADPFTQVGTGMSASERKVARGIMERLEYPSVTREHAFLKASGRVEYVVTTKDTARQALVDLSRLEGVIPAIETAHTLAWACAAAREMKREQAVVVAMAEQVDKDVWDIQRLLEEKPKGLKTK